MARLRAYVANDDKVGNLFKYKQKNSSAYPREAGNKSIKR
ncbi:protein of unknown function [Petrocella atlantisensis]|uniref:Uncharacterized protein n=1 Tax=Petrocella atlantisensis TaxID=2173034 RepID=A0A3P7NWI7_9FIRM|nr:protein of unknown function [Petrocella atlantisensis]